LVVRFLGSVIASDTVPESHGVAIGSPEPATDGATVSLHVVAFVTTPESVTLPPG
jgi:hypothetical protein